MISYLIDLTLFTALVLTSWRTGGMYRELRRLRSEEASFQKGLQDSDAAINRAAHAVVMLKNEGIATLQALETAIVEARALAEQLDDAVHLAEMRLSVANDADRSRSDPSPTQENWLSLIESRLASASTANR